MVNLKKMRLKYVTQNSLGAILAIESLKMRKLSNFPTFQISNFSSSPFKLSPYLKCQFMLNKLLKLCLSEEGVECSTYSLFDEKQGKKTHFEREVRRTKCGQKLNTVIVLQKVAPKKYRKARVFMKSPQQKKNCYRIIHLYNCIQINE